MKKFIIFPLISLILIGCSVKNFVMKNTLKKTTHPIQNTKLYKNYNKFQRDFILLSSILKEGFPYLEKIIPMEEFNTKTQKILKQLKHLNNKEEFLFIINNFLANTNNSHCRVNQGLIENPGKNIHFPFTLWPYKKNWYLLNIAKEQDRTLIGGKIIDINGVPIKKVAEKLSTFFPHENKFSLKYNLVNIFPQVFYLNKTGLFNNLEHLSLKIEKKSKYFILENLRPGNWNAEHYILKQKDFKKHFISQINTGFYHYKIFQAENFAYLKITNFLDKIAAVQGVKNYVKPFFVPLARLYVKSQFKKKNPQGIFKYIVQSDNQIFYKFLENCFGQIQQNKISNIILDLRNNIGGDIEIAHQLLYYLHQGKKIKPYNKLIKFSGFYRQQSRKAYRKYQKMFKKINKKYIRDGEILKINSLEKYKGIFAYIKNKKSPYYIGPKNSLFKGKIFLLIGHNTHSASVLLSVLLKDNGLIEKIIGVPANQNATGASGMNMLVLPETKINISIPTTYYQRPKGENGQILKPDIWIEKTVEDLIYGKDPVLTKVIEIIKNN